MPATRRAVAAAAPIHRAQGFCTALQGQQQQRQDSPLVAIARLTAMMAHMGGLGTVQEDTWPAYACGVLLEAWVELLADQSFATSSRSDLQSRNPAVCGTPGVQAVAVLLLYGRGLMHASQAGWPQDCCKQHGT